MQKFSIDIFKGVPIIKYGDLRYLIDTGSPITITNNDNLEFLGKELPVNSIQWVNLNTINRLLGYEIDALIGMDVLGKYTVEFNYSKNSIVFSQDSIDQPYDNIELQLGIPIVNLKVNGHNTKAYIDTGARLSYASHKILENIDVTNTQNEEDFHPLLGEFTTDVYKIPISIGDYNFNCKVGVLPPSLSGTLMSSSLDSILGSDFFMQYSVKIDFPNSRLICSNNNQ